MQTQRRTRSWTDVQLIISSISIALTLGLWGLLTARQHGSAGISGEALLPIPIEPDEVEPELLPGQALYLSDQAPPTPAPVLDRSRVKRRNGGGGGGGAVASTGSS